MADQPQPRPTRTATPSATGGPRPGGPRPGGPRPTSPASSSGPSPATSPAGGSAEGTEHDQEHDQQPAEGERYGQRNASGGGILGGGGSLVKELAYQSLRWHLEAVKSVLGISDEDLAAVIDDLRSEMDAHR